MQRRRAYFAAQGWYPQDPQRCRQALDGFFAAAQTPTQAKAAAIVPHAGWRFSGAITAQAFAALQRGLAGAAPELVWVFAGHTQPGERPRLMTNGVFATPVGDLAVASELAALMCREFDAQAEGAEPLRPDNALELPLPFIAALWPEAEIVVMTVPADNSAVAIGRRAAELTAERSAVAIGSTDLTHYGAPYGFSPKGSGLAAHAWSKEVNDAGFLDVLCAMRGAAALEHALDHRSACCPGAALAAQAFAQARGVSQGQVLSHQTSFDVAGGDLEMWVGYAALAF